MSTIAPGTNPLTDAPETAAPPAVFTTTRWSLVLRAGGRGGGETDTALESLCRQYWLPLYHYARRFGLSVEDAKDVVQDFFAVVVVSRQAIGMANPERGSFRSFLLTAFQNHMHSCWEKGQAVKRGRGVRPLSFDEVDDAGQPVLPEPVDARTPEDAYEKAWAMSVWNHSVRRVRARYEARGKGELFRALEPHVFGGKTETLEAVGARLGFAPASARTYVVRLREALRDSVKEELLQTVADASSLDAELSHFRSLFGR